jgi:hypothetical protein
MHSQSILINLSFARLSHHRGPFIVLFCVSDSSKKQRPTNNNNSSTRHHLFQFIYLREAGSKHERESGVNGNDNFVMYGHSIATPPCGCFELSASDSSRECVCNQFAAQRLRARTKEVSAAAAAADIEEGKSLLILLFTSFHYKYSRRRLLYPTHTPIITESVRGKFMAMG